MDATVNGNTTLKRALLIVSIVAALYTIVSMHHSIKVNRNLLAKMEKESKKSTRS